MGALYAGAGAAVTNVVAGFIPLGGGGWMDTVKQFAAAYIVSYAAERFMNPANAQLMGIGGFAGAAWSAVNNLLGGAQGIIGQFTGGGAASGDGVSGYFGDVSAYPPGALGDYTGVGDIVNPGFNYAYQAMQNG